MKHFRIDDFGLVPAQKAVIRAMWSRKKAMILAGGSGMGGKSYVLRIAAIVYLLVMSQHGYKDLKVLFTCNNYQQLKNRHFAEFQRFFGALGDFRDNDPIYGTCFQLHGNMGVICFRNLDAMAERRGSEFAAWFHDETTESKLQNFAAGLYTIRSDVPWSPVVTASNPDGVGFGWVKSWWRPELLDRSDYPIEPDGSLRYEEIRGARLAKFSDRVDPDGSMDPKDFIYIPFRPDDNPKFDELAFWRGVRGLPAHVQRARRYGNWDAPEGARFPMLAVRVHQFSPSKIWRAGLPAGWDKHCSVDYGIRNPFAALFRTHDPDGNVFFYDELYGSGYTAHQQIEMIKAKATLNERFLTFRGDPAMWIKTPDHFLLNLPLISDVYNAAIVGDPRFPTGFTKGQNSDRVFKWTTLETYLERNNDYPDMWISEECEELWKELEGAIFTRSTENGRRAEDLDKESADHALTAAFYGLDAPVARTSLERLVAEQAVPKPVSATRASTRVKLA